VATAGPSEFSSWSSVIESHPEKVDGVASSILLQPPTQASQMWTFRRDEEEEEKQHRQTIKIARVRIQALTRLLAATTKVGSDISSRPDHHVDSNVLGELKQFVASFSHQRFAVDFDFKCTLANAITEQDQRFGIIIAARGPQ
jgi:hypothetical protein